MAKPAPRPKRWPRARAIPGSLESLSGRDGYDGRTLEGRRRLFGEVMNRVRGKVGADFPVGMRFLAEAAVKDGYTVEEAKGLLLEGGADLIGMARQLLTDPDWVKKLDENFRRVTCFLWPKGALQAPPK